MSSQEKPEFVVFVSSSNCQFSNNFLNKLKTKPEIIINVKESLECLMMPNIPMSISV